MKRLQAIFFDFDGVLVDSNTIKNNAFSTLFAPYGETVIQKVLQYHQQHGGISRVKKIQLAHKEFIGQPLTKSQLDQQAQEYSTLVINEVVDAPWIAGARELMETLHGKLHMSLISGTPQDELRTIIQRRKMNQYFHEVLGSPTLKPDHITFLQRRYRLSADTCLFVGDASTDYRAAQQHGIEFIGIQGDYTFPSEVTVLDDCRNLLESISSRFLF